MNRERWNELRVIRNSLVVKLLLVWLKFIIEYNLIFMDRRKNLLQNFNSLPRPIHILLFNVCSISITAKWQLFLTALCGGREGYTIAWGEPGLEFSLPWTRHLTEIAGFRAVNRCVRVLHISSQQLHTYTCADYIVHPRTYTTLQEYEMLSRRFFWDIRFFCWFFFVLSKIIQRCMILI